MGNIINPATNKPFVQVRPNNQIIQLREEINRKLNASYDAAQTSTKNELHWQHSDQLSPNSANQLSVRKKLRSRGRYESANSGYLKGILLSLANDFVGSGPSLQVTDRRFDKDQQSIIERLWSIRAKKIQLRQKLWQLRYARSDSGESFGFYYTDREINNPVKASFRVFECDQVTSLRFDTQSKLEIDGIRFSASSGRPTQYHLLDNHPGETQLFSMDPLNGHWARADDVVHWFRKERTWLRGIPETTPTLPLWALLRRYTLAVVANAEIAADFTVLLKSMQPSATNPFVKGLDTGSQQSSEDWFDSFPVDRGLMTVLPSMYDMEQLDPKQPVTMYDSFVNALIQEAARPLCVPTNVALGNSGGYNMASGTLDRQLYRGTINQDRFSCEEDILDKDLDQWWFEAIRIPGYLDDDFTNPNPIINVINSFASLHEDPPEHVYRWDEVPEHTDPVKVAHAINLLHVGGHLSDVDIQEGRFNRSTEDHYRNLETQQARRKELSMIVGRDIEDNQEPTTVNEDGEDE